MRPNSIRGAVVKRVCASRGYDASRMLTIEMDGGSRSVCTERSLYAHGGQLGEGQLLSILRAETKGGVREEGAVQVTPPRYLQMRSVHDTLLIIAISSFLFALSSSSPCHPIRFIHNG